MVVCVQVTREGITGGRRRNSTGGKVRGRINLTYKQADRPASQAAGFHVVKGAARAPALARCGVVWLTTCCGVVLWW